MEKVSGRTRSIIQQTTEQYAGSISVNDSLLKTIKKKYVHARRRDTSKSRYLVRSSTFTDGGAKRSMRFSFT